MKNREQLLNHPMVEMDFLEVGMDHLLLPNLEEVDRQSVLRGSKSSEVQLKGMLQALLLQPMRPAVAAALACPA